MTIELRKVTWYSQIAAIVLSLVIFAVGFTLGRAYGQIDRAGSTVSYMGA